MDVLVAIIFSTSALSLGIAWYVAPRKPGAALVGLASSFAGFGAACATIHQPAAAAGFLLMVPVLLYFGIKKYGALTR